MLKRGMQGENIMKIQRILGLSVTGIFGPKTEAAVREWQKNNNLTVTGIVDNKTWDSLIDTKTLISEGILQNKIKKLVGIVPERVLNEIPNVIDRFHINTELRLAHFLSQCAHESGNFRSLVENLNYSSDGLLKTFPRYFTNRAIADRYQRNPEMIASRVYGNRMGNGAEHTKDGFKFRGRGYLQLTGKNNYKAFGESINVNLVEQPDLVATTYPLLSAGWFFDVNRLNSISDRGSTVKDITALTTRVNGGTKGLQDRIQHFNNFFKLLR